MTSHITPCSVVSILFVWAATLPRAGLRPSKRPTALFERQFSHDPLAASRPTISGRGPVALSFWPTPVCITESFCQQATTTSHATASRQPPLAAVSSLALFIARSADSRDSYATVSAPDDTD